MAGLNYGNSFKRNDRNKTEGVSQLKDGRWIIRVKSTKGTKNNVTTLGWRNTEQEAWDYYNEQKDLH